MINRFTMFKVFLNSFFIQSAWSFEKMQGLGFASAIAPAINDIYKDRGHAAAAIKRHMVFYNAHPYMASPILGAVIRMEEDVKDGKLDAGGIVSFKESLIGPYGAIGDNFFWGSVRPLASILGVLTALICGLWGPLVLYNIFHIWMRWVGLNKGYTLGGDVAGYVKELELPDLSLRIRNLATALLGIMTAVFIFKLFNTGMFGMQIYLLLLMAGCITTVAILLSSLLRKGVSVSLAIYLLFLPLFVSFIVMNILQRVG
jgi:mannose PTS system EIID component